MASWSAGVLADCTFSMTSPSSTASAAVVSVVPTTSVRAAAPRIEAHTLVIRLLLFSASR
jgi:hypothetical protein